MKNITVIKSSMLVGAMLVCFGWQLELSNYVVASDIWTISEVMANAIDENSGEFVEFYYAGDERIDLTGWMLKDSKKQSQIIDFTGESDLGKPGLELDVNSVLLVVDANYAGEYNKWLSEEVDLSTVVMLTVEGGSIGNGLNNAGDSIELSDHEGGVVLSYQWSADAGNGVSWERVGSDWISSDAAPGHTFGVSRINEDRIDDVLIVDEDNDNIEEDYILLDNISFINDYNGRDEVMFEGVVSVDYNVLEEGYLWVQDDMAGVGCKIADQSGFEIGDMVLVKGVINELTYHKVVNVEEVEVLGTDVIEYKMVGGGSLTDYEDMVVKTGGKLVDIDGNSWYLNDGSVEVKIYLKEKIEWGKFKPAIGDYLEVVGLVSQIKSGYRVLPRSKEDIFSANEEGESRTVLPSVGFDYYKLFQKVVECFVKIPEVWNKQFRWG